MIKASLKIHVICWTTYITYEILVSEMMNGGVHHPYAYILFYLLNIFLFYCHAFLVMPFTIIGSPTGFWKTIPLVVLELAVYIGIVVMVSEFLYMIGLRQSQVVLNRLFFVANIWRAFLFLLYATGYFFLMRYITKTREEGRHLLDMQRLQTNMAQLERDYLRAQIKPHLLFNTLNFVKYAAKHQPEKSDEAIIRLAEILDFSISRSTDGMIPISMELKQIKNIIGLNQLRFEGKLNIDLEVQLGSDQIRILPLILLTLVENIFKHGNLSDNDHPAHICITDKDNHLMMKTRNLSSNNSLTESTHTGLDNINRRLQQQYGDNFIFLYGEEGRFYNTELQMPYVDI